MTGKNLSQSFSSFAENNYICSKTPINLSSNSCSVTFDFLEDLISDHLNFTNSTAISLSLTDSSCVTTTHSISFCRSIDILTPSYCSFNPIVSTITPGTYLDAQLYPISHEEFYSISKVSSNNLNSKTNSKKYSRCQLSSSQNSSNKKYHLSKKLKLLLKQQSLSDFEVKYGLSSSIVSKLPIDVKLWHPLTYEFYFSSSSILHLPNFITVTLIDYIGQITEVKETPNYHQDGTNPQSVILHFGNYKVLYYLKMITLNFVNHKPLEIKFPPFVTLNIDREVIMHFNSDEDHMQEKCKYVSRMRLASNGQFYTIN